MLIIIHMGGAWRLSARAVAKLRSLIATGREWDLDELGKYLGEARRPDDLGG